MGKLTITKSKLLKEYKREVDEISEYLENKTVFSAEDICQIVGNILIENNVNVKINTNNLLKFYKNKVKSLKITNEEWRENYGIPEIITLIYDILEENV